MKRLVAAMTVAVLGAGFAAPAADVSPFQLEAEARYMDTSEEGGMMDMSIIGVGATYAFESVDPGSNPVEEAQFLARVPYAGLKIGFVGGDANTPMGLADMGGTQLMIGGGYADESVPVAVDLEFTTGSIDMDTPAIAGEMDVSGLDLQVGGFVAPNLLVGLIYETEDMEITIPGVGVVAESEESAIGIGAKWVQELGTGGSALNVELDYVSTTEESPGSPDVDGSEFGIGVDYYFNQLVGVGIGFGTISSDDPDEEGSTFGVRASYNAGTSVGVRVEWEKTSHDLAGVDDDDSFMVSVIGRF
ncbi:MAG: hypothetical protein ACYTKD_08250 [Planctomycetota bacterium]|jgi:hypothetical protein